jgi:hypothetical protein
VFSKLIRGILVGNFLQHFNVLIDYKQSMLCLDDRNVMPQEAKGGASRGYAGRWHTKYL